MVTQTRRPEPAEATTKVIESVREAAEPALNAVRKFLDTVDGVFPDIGEEGPRRRVIDAAFKMTEELIGVSTHFAERLVETTRTPEMKKAA